MGIKRCYGLVTKQALALLSYDKCQPCKILSSCVPLLAHPTCRLPKSTAAVRYLANFQPEKNLVHRLRSKTAAKLIEATIIP